MKWRGYTDVVEPTEPVFTTSILRGRLLLALKQIMRNRKIKSFDGVEETVFQALSQQEASSAATMTPLLPPSKASKKKNKTVLITEVSVILHFFFFFSMSFFILDKS